MLPQVYFETNQNLVSKHLAIFGATGDVTSRLFFPALASLVELGSFPENLSILALARKDWTTERYHQHIRQRFKENSLNFQPDTIEKLLTAVKYVCLPDLNDPAKIEKAFESSTGPIICYLALPPHTFRTILETLNQLKLPRESRVIFEKPFGEDFASCQELNQLVHKIFPESQIFRIDHFLGKQTVKNLLGFRFANRFFEPIWNHQHIEKIEITWDETLALEGRAAYYDSAGALRDMIQNHLLQLLCLVGMEPPTSFDERDFRERKVEVLRAVRRLSSEEIKEFTVRGRYDSGRIHGREVPAYMEEDGVKQNRNTETFAQVTLWIDNWRWAGVPFTLRSGKALAADRKEIAIFFRPVPHLAFKESPEVSPNVLRFQLDPDTIAMSVNLNGAGDPFQLEPHELTAELGSQRLPPYGHLLLDVLDSDSTMFIRGDEAEELWKIVDPVLTSWKKGDVPLTSYPAGSDGPSKGAPSEFNGG